MDNLARTTYDPPKKYEPVAVAPQMKPRVPPFPGLR